MKLSYCVTACNEYSELKNLLNTLKFIQTPDTEIVIQVDSDKVTPEVLRVINNFKLNFDGNLVVGEFPLNGDFAFFKNNLFTLANGEWIFQLDADELLNPALSSNLLPILEQNNVDLIYVPRVNIVEGILQEDVDSWGWRISKNKSYIDYVHTDLNSPQYRFIESNNLIRSKNQDPINKELYTVFYYKPLINWPDVQTRVYKNIDTIRWVGKVHERIQGFSTYAHLPEQPEWAILHVKDINRQKQQNKFYEQF